MDPGGSGVAEGEFPGALPDGDLPIRRVFWGGWELVFCFEAEGTKSGDLLAVAGLMELWISLA